MPLLSASELAEIREDVLDLFDDTCDIVTRQISTDEMGGFSEVETRQSDVPCRLDPASRQSPADLGLVSSQYTGADFYNLYFPYWIDIEVGSVVEINGEVLNTLSVKDIHTDRTAGLAVVSKQGPTQ